MELFISEDFNVHVFLNTTLYHEAAVSVGGVSASDSDEGGTNIDGTNAGGDGSMTVDVGGNIAGAAGKTSFLSSYPAVIGISCATLAFSIVLGILLAKRKIKKGYELYED